MLFVRFSAEATARLIIASDGGSRATAGESAAPTHEVSEVDALSSGSADGLLVRDGEPFDGVRRKGLWLWLSMRSGLRAGDRLGATPGLVSFVACEKVVVAVVIAASSGARGDTTAAAWAAADSGIDAALDP